MARTSTNNMKCKNEKDMISRFQELVNLLYRHFGVDKASPLYDKLVEKGYSFKRATFIGQMKPTSTPTGTYIKKLIEVAQAEGFAIDDQYILHYSKCHSHLLRQEAGSEAAADGSTAQDEPEIDFSEGEALDLEGGESSGGEQGPADSGHAGECEESAADSPGEEKLCFYDEDGGLVHVMDAAPTEPAEPAPALDESEEIQVPDVEESLEAGDADIEESEEAADAPVSESAEDADDAAAGGDVADAPAEAVAANALERRVKVLSAREKWELAAADYDLEYDPDEMLAKDSEGLIHLFCMEHSRYVQKIYPKGTKISRLGSTRPQRTIEYSADRQMFRMMATVVCSRVIEVEADSEMAATENVSSTEMIRIKHFLETKGFEVSRPLIKCAGSYVKKDR